MNDPEMHRLVVAYGAACINWWATRAPGAYKFASERGLSPPTPADVAASLTTQLYPPLLAVMQRERRREDEVARVRDATRGDLSMDGGGGTAPRAGAAALALPRSRYIAFSGSGSDGAATDSGGGGVSASTRAAAGAGAEAAATTATGSDIVPRSLDIVHLQGRMRGTSAVPAKFAPHTPAEAHLAALLRRQDEQLDRAAHELRRLVTEAAALRARLTGITAEAQFGLVATVAADIHAATIAEDAASGFTWAKHLSDFTLYGRISRGQRIRDHRHYITVKSATYAARINKRPVRRVTFAQPNGTVIEQPVGTAGRAAASALSKPSSGSGFYFAKSAKDGASTSDVDPNEAFGGIPEDELERERNGLCAVQIFVKPLMGNKPIVDDDNEVQVPRVLEKIAVEQFSLIEAKSRMEPHQNVMRVAHRFHARLRARDLPRGWTITDTLPMQHTSIVVMPFCPRTLHAELIHRRGKAHGDPPYFKEKTLLLYVLQIAKAILHCHEHRIVHRGIKLDKSTFFEPRRGPLVCAVLPLGAAFHLITAGRFGCTYNALYTAASLERLGLHMSRVACSLPVIRLGRRR